MRLCTLKSALLLPLALLCIACNPFEPVAQPEIETPRQRPAASMDIPDSEAGSTQVSLDAADAGEPARDGQRRHCK